jgi:hypothetical protein
LGCAGHRTKGSCSTDATCKWCTTFEQGWSVCANKSQTFSGDAQCDEASPNHGQVLFSSESSDVLII